MDDHDDVTGRGPKVLSENYKRLFLFEAIIYEAIIRFRDAALELEGSSELVQDLEDVLYSNADEAEKYFTSKGQELSGVAEGEDISFARLLPSYLDRKPFFDLILEGRLRGQEENSPENAPGASVSLQKQAKRYFDFQIRTRLAKYKDNGR